MISPSNVHYPGTQWAGHMTREDVVEAEAYFATWWDEAKEHVPHLADRAHVAMMVVSSPEHIGIMVNVVADAYRDYLEI